MGTVKQKDGDRLDPALFAASFAAKPTAKASASSPAPKQSRRKDATKGRPVRRLADGRTTVRVTETSPDAMNKDALESALERPSQFDEAQSMPTAKSLRFKQAKLGLQTSKTRPTTRLGKRRSTASSSRHSVPLRFASSS